MRILPLMSSARIRRCLFSTFTVTMVSLTLLSPDSVVSQIKSKPVDWVSIENQSGVEFSGGDVLSMASARLVDAHGNFWVSWDTSLTLQSHDLSLINSRREPLERVRLTDFALVGDSGMFICGEQGVLLESRNWGKNWSQRYFPNLDLLYFYGVEFNHAGVGILIGVTGAGDSRYRGIMYRSEDFGKTWNPKEDVSGMGFSRLSWDLTSNTFAVTAIGSILTSVDNGMSWKSVKLPIADPMRDAKFLGTLGISVGQKGHILKSNDGGANWEELKSPSKSNLTSVYIHSPAYWYIAGSGGEVWETLDGGANWNALHIARDVTLNGIKRTGKRLVVWGEDGAFLKLALNK